MQDLVRAHDEAREKKLRDEGLKGTKRKRPASSPPGSPAFSPTSPRFSPTPASQPADESQPYDESQPDESQPYDESQADDDTF